ERSRSMTALQTRAEPPAATATTAPLSSYARDYLRRISGGELGALPALLGIVTLCVVFTIADPIFFSAANFANVLTQGAAVTVIAMGLIFVLLLGEIDLSAGFTSGVCAAVLATALANWGVPWYVAVLAALATGTLIGTVLGTLVAKIGIPSFVVTLAAFLAFQGVVLLLIEGGTIVSITDPVIWAIANRNLPPWLGWLLYAVSVLLCAAVQLGRRRGRSRRGLARDPMSLVLLRIGILAVGAGAAVYVLNLDRGRAITIQGVPIVVPVIVVLLVLLT